MEHWQDSSVIKHRQADITVTANGYLVRPCVETGKVFSWEEESYSFESFESMMEFLKGYLTYRGKE